MLTHGNLAANLSGVIDMLDLSEEDRALSFLPLCHGFERMVAFVYMVTGVTMVLAEGFETLARDLKQVRPTVLTAVPRVFEKLHARLLATGREAGGLRRRVFEWAVRVAEARGRRQAEERAPSAWLSLQSRLAERLVFAKVRDRLGGCLRFAVSGSAPLRRDIAQFFFGVGLPLLEGYGMTETAPVLTVTPLDRVRFGAVGMALPNVELRIADDGEILARGPNVMPGYFNRPEETAKTLVDGWLLTGDIGRLDEDGYLFITDRKKELLVTSGGKKIAPQPIEAALRAHDLVAEAVLVGERRHFPSAIVVPDFGVLATKLGATRPADAAAARALVDEAAARALFQQVVDAVNTDLARFEQIKKFTLLDREFTIESGELTPTLKVKRRVVETRHADAIDAMYGQGAGAPRS
jgi:long-chain acyl-CoA synthetase